MCFQVLFLENRYKYSSLKYEYKYRKKFKYKYLTLKYKYFYAKEKQKNISLVNGGRKLVSICETDSCNNAPLTAESLEIVITKVMEKSSENMLKLIDGLLEKSKENVEKVISFSNNNLKNLFVKFDSNMKQVVEKIHATLSTLSTSISEFQKQVFKQNETPLIESMTKAFWAVDQERKDEERRASNEIISGLEQQPGASDRDIVTLLCRLSRRLSKLAKSVERRLIKFTGEKSSKLNNDQPFRLNK
ncbi:hypothetical protein HELRODRAFT_175887 [Helobdella robusta]|uniref:Uncharacterized protein n=1 Tax=Helobdella robusta TaxID=6412 RepID=T1F9U3_HELRO|nr:hypothetical protein HELRODRAFT_175887 [Helobdella robusta]ESO00454.1 hypothetical protein HELRODRAFT_175887 [Helobdella robusta]